MPSPCQKSMNAMIEQNPIVFAPYLKSVIWGGNKICDYKGIIQTEPNVGESWEISAVPGHESVVAEGTYKGLTLTELIDRFGAELLGEKVMKRYGGKFPLLIKFIDAADNLSVQVHPDDALAQKRHNSLGKTEMWYIIRADKDAKIYAGLRTALTPDDYVKRVADGTFADTLAVHDSMAGDVFFLPAGRVHAIGAGNLLAEIQESSDITYRIYDYDRRDAEGNPRELHTESAKDAIDYTVYDEYKNPPVPADVADCEIVSCEHFTTDSILLDGELNLRLDHESFAVLICLEGVVTIKTAAGEMRFTAGHTVLIPAAVEDVVLTGHGKLLKTQV